MDGSHPVSIGWPQALAWRLRRQLLDPIGEESATGVVRRLGAIKAEPQDAAELATRTRRKRSRPGEVAAALAAGTLIKTFAFRGATHLLTPEEGGAYLALRASGRQWELPSWQAYYGLTPADWPGLRDAVRRALANGPLTFDELGAAITSVPKFRHLDFVFRERNWTLTKPLAWQGVMSFGPDRGRATFQSLETNPRWRPEPDLDVAGRHAVEMYLRTYGPATIDHLRYWLGSGLSAGGKQIGRWIAALGDRVAVVKVGDQPYLIMADDIEELHSTTGSQAVRLLPGYDQWVIGPGTADAHIVPPARRALFSRPANIVIAGGFVAGTWALSGDRVTVDWFGEAGAAASDLIAGEVDRLAAILDLPLQFTIKTI